MTKRFEVGKRYLIVDAEAVYTTYNILPANKDHTFTVTSTRLDNIVLSGADELIYNGTTDAWYLPEYVLDLGWVKEVTDD
ncbi:hypothetical protein NVP1077O_40 [Vibrio phage 1.077.O._10N.261.45.A10]|nr:hypothetical protein NVP1070O_40 [Vibrio phage 1.070.O._10N.261.45.B2]AUR85618.1 hypothetical protein NVP1077O_40 [Vibrio phage 1.077.O._10N.261.45.A10]